MQTQHRLYMQKLITCLVLVLMLQIGYAQIPGTLDLSFNPAENSFLGNGPNGNVKTAVQQPDGKFIIGGSFTSYNGVNVNKIARINPDGSLDRSFTASVSGAASNTAGDLRTIVLQPDGKILIGGEFARVNNLDRPNFTRLNTNGTIDESFNTGGAGTDGPVTACLILPNDSIVIGGRFKSYNGVDAKLGVAFLGMNGLNGPTANPSDAYYNNRSITDIKLQSDGKLLISGDIFYRNNSVIGLARLNVNRTIDNTFFDFRGFVKAMAIQTNGNILISGSWTVANGQVSPGIARLLPTFGYTDGTFNPGTGFSVNVPGLNPEYRIAPEKLYIQSDGKILAAGWFSTYNAQPVGPLVRINADGTLDLSFNLSSEIPTYIPYVSVVKPEIFIPVGNNKFLFGGYIKGQNQNSREHLFLINANGSIDRTFNPRRGFNNRVFTTTVQPNGMMLAGGNFTAYNDTIARNFTRLMPDGSLDRVFNNQMAINGPVFASALQTDGKILIAGKFTMIQGVRRNSVARLNMDGSLDAGFNIGGPANDSIKAIVVRPDGNIVIGGAFTKVGSTNAARIMLLAPNGNPINGFGGKGANNTINDMVALPDNSVAVGGSFNQFDGTSNAHLVRITQGNNISILNSNDFQGVINCIKRDPEGNLLIGGKFSMGNNGVNQQSIAKIFLGTAQPFSAGAGFTFQTIRSGLFGGTYTYTDTGTISNIIIQPNGRIIVSGLFSHYKNTNLKNTNGEHPSIIRLMPDGSIDYSFRFIYAPNPHTLTQLAFGNVVFTGNYSKINNIPRSGIASLFAFKAVPNEKPCDAFSITPGLPGDPNCANTVQGTTFGSTTGAVWYKFTATSSTHFIKVAYSTSAMPSLSIFKGSCGIASSENLTLIQRQSQLNNSTGIVPVSKLKPDSVYYISYENLRAISNNTLSSDFNFNICLLTSVINDDVANAIEITPKSMGDTTITGLTRGSIYLSTFNFGETVGNNGVVGDVWFKFKATQESHLFYGDHYGTIEAKLYSSRGLALSKIADLGIHTNLLPGFDTLKIDSTYYIQFSSRQINITPDQAAFSFLIFTPINNTPCTALPISPGPPAVSTNIFTEGNTSRNSFNGDFSCSDIYYNPDVWYKFTATSNNHILELLGEPNGKINASVFTDTLCQTKGYGLIFCRETFVGTAIPVKLPLSRLQIGKSYLIRIASAQPNKRGINFKLRILSPPTNDEPCGAVTLVPGAPIMAANPYTDNAICSNPVVGSFVGSTKDNRYSSQGFSSINNDIWFKFIATSGTHVINIRKNNNAGPPKSVLSLYKGIDCNGLFSATARLITEPTNNFSTSELFGFQDLVVGETYFIRLGIINPGNNDISTPFDICVLTPTNDTRQTALEIMSANFDRNTPVQTHIATPDSVFKVGTPTNDIWYKFKATSRSQSIRFLLLAPLKAKFGFIPSGDSVLNIIDSFSQIPWDGKTTHITIGSNNLIPDSIYHFVIAQRADRYYPVNFFSLLNPQNHTPEKAEEVYPGEAGDTSCTMPVYSSFTSGSSNPAILGCVENSAYSRERWYHFMATSTRHFLRYSGPKAWVNVYDSVAVEAAFNLIFCDSIPGGQGRIQVLKGLVPGQSYYLRLGAGNAVGDQDFDFCLITPPAIYNDEPCNAIPITQCNLTTGHVLFATPSTTADCGGGKFHDVWYRFVSPDNGVMSVGASELGFNPTVRFVKLTNCAQPNLGTDIVCLNSPGQAELIDLLNLSPGEDYYMAIGYSDKAAFQSPSSGRFEIRIASSTNAFVSISSSQNGAICQGTPVTFTASHFNSGPNPSFQWLLNGNNVGNNSSRLTIDSLNQGDTVRCRLQGDIVCTGPVLSNKIGMQVAPRLAWYLDSDNDGFGDAANDSLACTKPVGYVANSTDCNDAESTINTSFQFYKDDDGDGFGIEPLLDVCAQNGTKAPRGYSLLAGDTDDSNGKLNPHAPAAEYFIDKDPGPGNGLPINFSVVNDSIIIEENIIFENLNPGFHTLGIRVFNAGNWSLFEARNFYVDDPTLPIISGEFFFDTDPGAGKATPFFPEVFDDTAKATLIIPTGALRPGFHYVGFRTLDGAGKWGLTEQRGFYVDSSFTIDEQPIVAVEYYLDTDPGAGKGTAVNVPASDTIDLKEPIGTSLLSPGFHFVTLRSQSADGRWGLGEVRGFYVQPAEVHPNPITSAEYFLTQDPGTGTGNAIAIPQPVDTIKGISPLAIPNSVPVGTYLLGLRVKDLSGAWSFFETDTVTVTSNATNLSFPFTQICAGLSTEISFTANGPYNAGNIFTAQLSNGLGDFSSPVNIGNISTTTSGTFTITIPMNTAPGLNYRIRIASSSPASASVISGKGFAISGSLTPADANTIQTLSATEASHLVDANCRMITSILPNGELPVSGSVSARVWVEDNVPLNNGVPYVGRHYEITPNLNGSIATARVTLYFTQAEFDAYNNHPNTNSFERLPMSPTDAAGKANLLVFKYSGTSSDGSGLPSTYPNDIFVIDPADESINWNEALQRWEVSFDVTGFSGFIVSTSPSFIHGPTILYTNWIGNISEEWEDAANWSHGVPNAATIAVIPAGRQNYPTISASTTVKGVVTYEGTTVIVNDGVLVTIKVE